ncbi:MAG: isoquinoline 1-oxidoreductase subunit alpha [Actinomycetota bacterium]|nr:isoquinoline 1-oxidoreductase subunit alpha [Actinomycetota bacterium]
MPQYSFTLNGKTVQVDAPGDLSVLWALRDKLGVTGPKYGCGINVCKACTSHLDGKAFNPCVTNLRDVAGKQVTTIEGLADGDNLHPVQEAWLEQDVAQCGYCQPGQIMAAVALLKRTKNPTDEEIDAIENVCRCGSYFRIREAIKAAAAKMATPVAGPATGGANGIPDVAPEQLPATGLDAKTAAVGAAALGAAAVTALLRDDALAAED